MKDLRRKRLALILTIPVVAIGVFLIVVPLGATDFSSPEDISALPELSVTPPPPPREPPPDSIPGSPPTVPPAIIVSPTAMPEAGEAPPVPQSIAEARTIAEQALHIARSIAPDVYLFTVIYGQQNMYGFVSPDGGSQLALLGEGNDPGAWEVVSEPILPQPLRNPPPRLDFSAVERSPSEALIAFSEKVGVGPDLLRVQLQADMTTDGKAFWSAIPTDPSSSHGWLCVLEEPNGGWVDPC